MIAQSIHTKISRARARAVRTHKTATFSHPIIQSIIIRLTVGSQLRYIEQMAHWIALNGAIAYRDHGNVIVYWPELILIDERDSGELPYWRFIAHLSGSKCTWYALRCTQTNKKLKNVCAFFVRHLATFVRLLALSSSTAATHSRNLLLFISKWNSY